ncbi:CRISPR-associated endonuclease Cas1, partial [Candidatus Bathyarchaeota archaeon]|nr:CRISPR-associated endonuclease Cas1 [Candidatus Bathyarchaeota archaeon]
VQLGFERRTGRGATDPFNVSLNFGYKAYLFKACWKEALRAGFDPNIGFLHLERPGKPSLILDLMEEFRPLIDRVCLSLYTRGSMPARVINARGRLTRIAYAKLLETLDERLQRSYGLDRRIGEQVSLLRDVIMGRCVEYVPYRMDW